MPKKKKSTEAVYVRTQNKRKVREDVPLAHFSFLCNAAFFCFKRARKKANANAG